MKSFPWPCSRRTWLDLQWYGFLSGGALLALLGAISLALEHPQGFGFAAVAGGVIGLCYEPRCRRVIGGLVPIGAATVVIALLIMWHLMWLYILLRLVKWLWFAA